MTEETVNLKTRISPDGDGETPLVKPLSNKVILPTKLVVAAVVIIMLTLGSSTGYILAKSSGLGSGGSKSDKDTNKGQTGKNVVVGSTDTKTFKDCAKGELAKNDGKLTDEGSHMLVREGGDSQTVYLTSSVVDLNQFVGKKLEICGETFSAQKAGWLMDVGRVKIQ